MRKTCGAYLVVLVAGLTPAAAQQSTVTVVRAIRIADENGLTRVTIDADGPLPLPQSESLNAPPRIFFDLTGVTHKVPATIAARSAFVKRVRVGLRSSSPAVTRVVLDLTQLLSSRIEIDARQTGRMHILIGPESAIFPGSPAAGAAPPPAAPVTGPPPAPPAVAPPAPNPIERMPAPPVPAGNAPPAITNRANTPPPPPPPIARSPRNPTLSPEAARPLLPQQEIFVYRKMTFGLVSRMEGLMALVARIDAGEEIEPVLLAAAADQFTELRRELEIVKLHPTLAATHELLMTSCTLGAMAARFGIEAVQGNAEVRQRASSAAAGSLMLFDRACADIGCSRTRR
jgi:hypothetical protein